MSSSVPLAFGIALVISHYAPRWIATPVAYVIDLLAAVPSVVYGLWGAFYLANKLKPMHLWLHDTFGDWPVLGSLFGEPNATGRSILTAGIVLAIMILPFIVSVSRQVLLAVPNDQREGALALGATKWESTWKVVVPFAKRGIYG